MKYTIYFGKVERGVGGEKFVYMTQICVASIYLYLFSQIFIHGNIVLCK